MAKAQTNKQPNPTEQVAEGNDQAQAYTVLARRYRPRNFAEVVGQEAVAQSLANAIKSNRVAHAYLFTGARGVGKTSTARILAKCLNCVQGPTPTPCGVCDMCRGIASGEDVDVLEIDAASNRGIDEIRNLRSNVNYRPSRSRYKIYVIDEVHMLTREAFNALLKTLEEPPAHVKFFFATTDPQRIPITILSRCQRFDLNGIGTPLIRQRLTEIVQSEGMQADEEALDLVARRANASMRDAQSLLDQLLAFGGERVTVEQVYRLLGTASEEHIVDLARHVLGNAPGKALQGLEKALSGGFQMGELVDQLIAYWRDLMVLHCGGAGTLELSMPERYRQVLSEQAKALPLDTILAGLDVLSATRTRLRDSNHGRTLVEMALVRLGRLGELLSVTQLTQMLTALPATSAASGGRVIAPPEGLKKNDLKTTERAVATASAEPLTLSDATLPEIWSQILRQMGPLMAAHLDKAKLPAIFGPNALALRFPAEYNQAREYCQAPAAVARLDEAFRKVLGRVITVRMELAPPNGLAPGSEVASEEPSVGQRMPTTVILPEPEAPANRLPVRNPREEAEKEVLVRRAIEVLGASIIRVDPGFGSGVAGEGKRLAPKPL